MRACIIRLSMSSGCGRLLPNNHLVCAVAAQAAEAQLAAKRERAACAEAALTALQREHEAALEALRQQSGAALAALREESQAVLAGAHEESEGAALVAREQAEGALAAAREQAGAAQRQLQDARDETAVLAEQVRTPTAAVCSLLLGFRLLCACLVK